MSAQQGHGGGARSVVTARAHHPPPRPGGSTHAPAARLPARGATHVPAARAPPGWSQHTPAAPPGGHAHARLPTGVVGPSPRPRRGGHAPPAPWTGPTCSADKEEWAAVDGSVKTFNTQSTLNTHGRPQECEAGPAGVGVEQGQARGRGVGSVPGVPQRVMSAGAQSPEPAPPPHAACPCARPPAAQDKRCQPCAAGGAAGTAGLRSPARRATLRTTRTEASGIVRGPREGRAGSLALLLVEGVDDVLVLLQNHQPLQFHRGTYRGRRET